MNHLTTGTHGGTGQLSAHLRKCNPEFAQLEAITRAKKRGEPTTEESIGDSNMVQSVLNMSNPAGPSRPSTYCREKDLFELAKMVSVCGLPYNFPSHPEFIHYIREVYNPKFEGFTRNTIKTAIFKHQAEHCHYLRCLFAYFDGRFSITSDMDRIINGNDYFTVTVHWIDHDWIIQKRIIGYKYIEETKTGVYIATTIESILKYFGLVGKTMSVTLDNASNNLSAVDFLKIRICPFDVDVFHIKCAAHIYNLIVKDGVATFGSSCEKIRIACN